MKIILSIVTYKNEEHLNRNLQSLYASDITKFNFKVEIINNHSYFILHDEFKHKVKVLNNSLRPDWSTGHITKDYNSALVRNFVKLSNPEVDWVITVQDDVIWKPNWATELFGRAEHHNLNFITSGIGDSIVACTAEAIRHIGLWDERFNAIATHEGDMFARAVLWNPNHSSINDMGHGRVWQPCDDGKMGQEHVNYRYDSIFITQPSRNADQYAAIDAREVKGAGFASGLCQESIYQNKWGHYHNAWSIITSWIGSSIRPTRPCGDSYFSYPYFELDMYNWREKGYVFGGLNGATS